MSNFGNAWLEARKQNKEVFTYKGKVYHSYTPQELQKMDENKFQDLAKRYYWSQKYINRFRGDIENANLPQQQIEKDTPLPKEVAERQDSRRESSDRPFPMYSPYANSQKEIANEEQVASNQANTGVTLNDVGVGLAGATDAFLNLPLGLVDLAGEGISAISGGRLQFAPMQNLTQRALNSAGVIKGNVSPLAQLAADVTVGALTMNPKSVASGLTRLGKYAKAAPGKAIKTTERFFRPMASVERKFASSGNASRFAEEIADDVTNLVNKGKKVRETGKGIASYRRKGKLLRKELLEKGTPEAKAQLKVLDKEAQTHQSWITKQGKIRANAKAKAMKTKAKNRVAADNEVIDSALDKFGVAKDADTKALKGIIKDIESPGVIKTKKAIEAEKALKVERMVDDLASLKISTTNPIAGITKGIRKVKKIIKEMPVEKMSYELKEKIAGQIRLAEKLLKRIPNEKLSKQIANLKKKLNWVEKPVKKVLRSKKKAPTQPKSPPMPNFEEPPMGGFEEPPLEVLEQMARGATEVLNK